MTIHHVGMVVKNIDEHYGKYYRDALGFEEISETYVDETIGVKVAFINLNDKIYLELVEPLNDNSPVRNYLNKKGQTLHHLCFEVNDIMQECERLRNMNYMITMGPTPAKAFNGRSVAFLMSKDENFLIELLQIN